MNEQAEKSLRFQRGGNAKLDADIASFSLPAGWTCPGAKDCLTKVDPDLGTLVDGHFQKFRCFAAISETRPSVRDAHWHNYELLTEARTRDNMFELLKSSFPRKVKKLRVHVSGDFFNLAYFGAWMDVAKVYSDTLLYAYTKSLKFVKLYLEGGETIPNNFRLTLSQGGLWDDQIQTLRTVAEEQHNTSLGTVKVVFHPTEAQAEGLAIDHNDSLAMKATDPFALLLHAQQPADSPAAEAVKKMRREGISFSYPAKTKDGNNKQRKNKGRTPLPRHERSLGNGSP
jgi:hypothetical protein